jgi:hypothetical protein
MKATNPILVLPLLLLPLLTSACNQPERNTKDVPPLEKKGTNIDGNPATGAAPAPGALPSGISASGELENRPRSNRNNPQTNPGTNLDGTQTPTPEKPSTTK